MVKFYIEMKGGFDSKPLWNKIGRKGINVTDTGEKVLVYGTAPYIEYVLICYQCQLAVRGSMTVRIEPVKEGEVGEKAEEAF